MKRIILIFLATISTIALSASEKVYVSMVKEYTENSGFVLPNKTISIKTPGLIVANQKYDFTKQFSNIVSKIQDEDLENKVYAVMLKFAGAGISIDIEAKDIVDLDDTEFYGDFIVERSHFVLIKNEDNADLLKTYFKKDKKREVIFQRCYEMVVEESQHMPTIYQATYDERQRKIILNKYIINGSDRLNPQNIDKPTPEPTTDDNDAFDIDVELFE
jgi:hypothetical protein